MRTRTQKRILFGTTVTAIVLALSAVAWACTPHMGYIWFCPANNQNCTEPNRTANDPADQAFVIGATAYAHGEGLQNTNADHTLYYTDDLDPSMICARGGSPFTNENEEIATATTDGSGNFGATQVVMPVAPNTWSSCAVHLRTFNNTPIFDSSNHRHFMTVL